MNGIFQTNDEYRTSKGCVLDLAGTFIGGVSLGRRLIIEAPREKTGDYVSYRHRSV